MVKPGKYIPIGNKIAPMLSDKPPTTPAQNGPYSMAQITTGTKAKPIFTTGVEIDKNRDRTISMVTSIATWAKVLVLIFIFFSHCCFRLLKVYEISYWLVNEKQKGCCAYAQQPWFLCFLYNSYPAFRSLNLALLNTC